MALCRAAAHDSRCLWHPHVTPIGNVPSAPCEGQSGHHVIIEVTMNLDVWRTQNGTSEIEQLQTIPGLAESARNPWSQSWAGEGWWRAGLATRRGRIPRESMCVPCISQRPGRGRPVEIFLAGPPAKRNHRERFGEHNVPGHVVVLGPSLSLSCPPDEWLL